MIRLPFVPPQKTPRLEITNFIGGLNNRDASSEIADNEAQSLLNVEFSGSGEISKRNGTILVADVPSENKVRGLHAVYYGNASATQLMATRVGSTNVKLFYRAASGTTWTIEASGGAGLNLADADVEFENFSDGTNQITFCTDGTTYRKFTPTTNVLAAAADAPATAPTLLRVYKNKMYAVANTSATLAERVYFSAIGNGDSWTDATDWFDVPSVSNASKGTTGDPITALAVYQDRLIIFKNRSIFAWDGSTLRQITDKHGCVGKRAFANTDNSLYFADTDGVYRLSGEYVEKASNKIQSTFDAVPDSLRSGIAMAYFDGALYVSTAAASATYNNIVLVNYLQLPRDAEGQHPWSYWNNAITDGATPAVDISPLAVSAFSVYTASSTTDPILTAGSSRSCGSVIRIGTGTADAAIPFAPTTVADAAAGNPNGAYLYKVTFVISGTETTGGAQSTSLTVVSKKINISAIPIGPSGTTARKIYRTVAAGTAFKLLTTLSNNTATTYQDDTADGALGAAMPTTLTQDMIINSNYVTKDFFINGWFKEYFVTYKSQSSTSILSVTPVIDFQTFTVTKQWDAKPAGYSVYGTGTYGTSTYGGGTSTLITRGATSYRGKYIRYSIMNNAASQPWTIYALRQNFKSLKLR